MWLQTKNKGFFDNNIGHWQLALGHARTEFTVMVFLSGRQAIAWQCAMYLACYLTLKTKIFTLFVVKKIIKTSKTRSHFCQLWTIISHHLTKGGGEGEWVGWYSGFQVTGMIKWGQKLKPPKIRRACNKPPPPKIPCWISINTKNSQKNPYLIKSPTKTLAKFSHLKKSLNWSF